MTLIKNTIKALVLLALVTASGSLVSQQPQTAQAAGLTYYVATNGNDSRTCAQAQSIGTPKKTLNNAMGCLSAGDTLLVRGGTYNEFIQNGIAGGTSSNYTRIAAFPGETVWVKPNAGCNCYPLYLFATGEQYIEFDGINFDALNATYGSVKIEGYDATVGNPHHIRIKNATLLGDQGSGPPQPDPRAFVVLLVTAQTAGITGGNEFINLTISNSRSYGIYANRAGDLFDNITVHDVRGAGFHIYNGYGLPPDDTIIRNSKVYNIFDSDDGIHTTWGIVTYGSNNKIYNNLIYNLSNGSGLGTRAIELRAGSGTEVYNNTIYNNQTYGLNILNTASNAVIRNNIFFQNGNNSSDNYLNASPSTVEDHNIFGNDPKFINAGAGDFRLTSASTNAINAGVNLGPATTDITGANRTGIYDIGAYEYGGVVTPPPPGPTPPPPPSPGPSPSGTRVPPSSSITDNSGNVWTIGPNQEILRNGVQAASGSGSQILWYQNNIYVFGGGSNWFQWTGSSWTNIGPNDPSAASPSGTRVPLVTSITDSSGNTWTLGSGSPFAQILQNGTQVAGATGSQILWYQNNIDVKGDDGQWYRWNGTYFAFVGSADPQGALSGDLNYDHIINSLDWSYMNSKWFTNDATADIDHNGLVNSLDFSIMNSNWFKTW